MQYPSVSLVIPLFNEAERLDNLFQSLDSFSIGWKGEFHIILVDDGSADETAINIQANQVFNRLQEQAQITLLRQQNTGKGGALQTGIQMAGDEYILTLDADMAAPPLQLIQWLTSRNGFHLREVLIGSRELPNSVIRENPLRKFVGNIFNMIIRVIVGLPYRDTQCGFKLYPRVIAQRVFADLQTPGWAHDVEILLRVNKLGCAIIEMPVTWSAMPGSKISVLRDSWKMFTDVIRIRRILRK
jgi:dolichyl-phosphate beta-glucosyltransferase